MGPPGLGRHVALIGFMGAGKTTIGQEAARRLGRALVDTDDEIERRTGSRIADYFRERGEAEFRSVEEELVASVLTAHDASVVALGGGAVLSQRTRDLLRARAFTVLIDVDPDEAWARVEASGRPLAQGEATFRELYEERLPVYQEAAEAVASDAAGVVLEAGAVLVEEDALTRLAQLVAADSRAALVTEPRVAATHGDAARRALGGRLAEVHELPTGEAAKTLAEVERLWRELSLTRRDTIVALGGGAVLDAAGFAASAYLRGIRWLSVPTTLLAQVDAGIGGKTAVDLPAGKNLVGTFHWPARTVIDPSLLSTLPDDERRNGLAEVVKTGLLAGEPLWELAEPEAVRACAVFKTALCLQDPYDERERLQLNLGHTFAHALEAAADFELPHGRAVALGLLAALRLSGLETHVVETVLAPEPVRVDRRRAWEALRRDKKAGRLVLLDRPGEPRVAELPEADVRAALDSLIAG